MLLVVVKELLDVVLHRNPYAVQVLVVVFFPTPEGCHATDTEAYGLRAAEEADADAR